MVTRRLPNLLFAVGDPTQLAGATLELASYLDRALGQGVYTLASSRDQFAARQRTYAGLLGVTAVLAALALLVAAVNILDHDGRRTGKTLAVQDGRFTIDGAKDKTLYYEVVFQAGN